MKQSNLLFLVCTDRPVCAINTAVKKQNVIAFIEYNPVESLTRDEKWLLVNTTYADRCTLNLANR